MTCLMLSGVRAGGQCTPGEFGQKAGFDPGLQARRCHTEATRVDVEVVEFNDGRG